jgi:hypothetical protein
MVAITTGMVRVIHEANKDWFPIGGKTVGNVKKCLQDAFGIPYFAEAIVNGKAVALAHTLAGGDCLEFAKAFGHKAHKKESRTDAEAKGILAHYPELVEIGNKVKGRGLDAEKSIDLMAEMVARWCKDHFGPLTADAIATANQVAVLMSSFQERATRVAHGMEPRKAGRKPTTRELADFAQDHSHLTWKEISALWNREDPQGKKVKLEDVRGAYRRAYGDKSTPSKKKRAE